MKIVAWKQFNSTKWIFKETAINVYKKMKQKLYIVNIKHVYRSNKLEHYDDETIYVCDL